MYDVSNTSYPPKIFRGDQQQIIRLSLKEFLNDELVNTKHASCEQSESYKLQFSGFRLKEIHGQAGCKANINTNWQKSTVSDFNTL